MLEQGKDTSGTIFITALVGRVRVLKSGPLAYGENAIPLSQCCSSSEHLANPFWFSVTSLHGKKEVRTFFKFRFITYLEFLTRESGLISWVLVDYLLQGFEAETRTTLVSFH